MFIHDTNSSIGQEQFSDDSDVGETIGESGNVAEAEWAVEAENTTSDESIEEPLEYSNVQKPEVIDNIIKMPDLNYVPGEYGMGYEIFHSMKKYQNLVAQITFMFVAPVQAIGMIKVGRPDDFNTTSFLDLLIGGGPISSENLLYLRDLLPGTNVFICFGQTEIAGVGTTFRTNLRKDIFILHTKPKSCGRPIPGFSYKIVDVDTEEVLSYNQEGELRIRSDSIFTNYYNMDSLEVWDDDGWMKTGDIVYYDEDLCFYIIDRMKEMLKFQSWHIAPTLLEGILQEHSAVQNAAVIGKPHDEDGEHPLGVVISMEDADITPGELVEYVNSRVDDDRQKLRGGVIFVKDVPYTPSGKIDSQTGQTDTYDELLPRCIRTAITLQAHNLTSNDIICLCSYNQLNSCVPYLAGLFIGVKVCSLDPSMSFTESKHLLNQVKPKIIFVVSEKKKMYENLLDDISLNAELVEFCEEGFGKFLKPSPDEDKFAPVKVANLFDTAVIMFSSGTTGLAKGICLNHYSLLCQVKNFISFECDTTRCLSFATFYWISAVFLLIQSIMKGSARILCKNFEPLHVWYTISNFKATYLFMASNQAIALLKTLKPRSVCTDSLKIIHAGGGPISPDHLLSLRELLPNVEVVLVYGQTEVAGFGFMFKTTSKDDMILMKRKPKSCGKPIRGFWYKIVDVETGKTLGRNQIGELRFKTRFQLNGYYNLDSSGIWDSEGWLKTGDICYYDEDQCFFIVDRIKEMMKFQSWHVAPAFIEGILYGHFAVKVAVVIGVPHDEDGEHPLGIIVLSEEAKGVKAETLVEYVNSRVDDRQKLRAGIVFVDDIPYTPSGKIKRNALKHTILERLGIGCKA
ncbi:long-chain-fatty-acid--coa ligase [Holotrichia oblita]|uniref:Long-chain-fatty-acid--coa ligase n=1 Tax=Holotrichia oblita TaxID=644536 RepID=A0ACB9TXE4_HOLOL|nr:long-chain-fatty-acid--coa ligase [Holotrichia oblita]